MSNSLTVPILLRKYANNLYSHFVISSCISLNRNTCRTKYLFCCIAHADCFTIKILVMSFMLLNSILSTQFLKLLLRHLKKIKSLQVNISVYFQPGNGFLSEIYSLLSLTIMKPLRTTLKSTN